MRSNGCMRSSSGGSRRRLCCPPPRRPPCCFGRCSSQASERSTAGKRSPPRPSLSPLTSPPETIPSCSRRSRRSNYQPLSGRHSGASRTSTDNKSDSLLHKISLKRINSLDRAGFREVPSSIQQIWTPVRLNSGTTYPYGFGCTQRLCAALKCGGTPDRQQGSPHQSRYFPTTA